ncbi:MAG: anthranilate phosphoribosyltransferase, partial [Ignavibacteriales bacterium]|nr:anthranilate phosphoribosyltransferase [Ignavibacteriales bacterium]
ISLEEPTTVFEVNNQLLDGNYDVESKAFGLPTVKRDALSGGSAETNAKIAMNILEGHKTPHRDVVVANAAFGLLVAGRAPNVREGVQMAVESIDSGQAFKKLNDLKSFTQR